MIIAAQRSGGRWPSFSAAKTVSRDVGSHPSATTGHKIERMFGVMSRMELTNERLDLLAACRIRGISWELVAREAQRVGRVGPLLDGDIGEKGQAATEARELLAVAPPLEERREEVLREHEAATAAGTADHRP